MQSDLPHPHSATEVRQHVIACVDGFLSQHPTGNNKNWNDLKARLLRWVNRIEPKLAFDGLLWILENETRYQYQLVAGELLLRTALTPSLSLRELLHRVLPKFEESARTVPAYLRTVFGLDAMVLALEELEETTHDPVLIGKIKTMRWWMDAPPEAFASE